MSSTSSTRRVGRRPRRPGSGGGRGHCSLGWNASASSMAPTCNAGIVEFAVVAAVEGRGARRRGDQSEQRTHGRRLTGAVRAEEAGHHSGADGEGQIVDGEGVAEALGQMVDHSSVMAGALGRRGDLLPPSPTPTSRRHGRRVNLASPDRGRTRTHEPVLVGVDHRFDPVTQLQLAQDVGDVGLDRRGSTKSRSAISALEAPRTSS
jgi:hypothetical protein